MDEGENAKETFVCLVRMVFFLCYVKFVMDRRSVSWCSLVGPNWNELTTNLGGAVFNIRSLNNDFTVHTFSFLLILLPYLYEVHEFFFCFVMGEVLWHLVPWGRVELQRTILYLACADFKMLSSMYPELKVSDHPNGVSWDPIGTNSQQTWEGRFS